MGQRRRSLLEWVIRKLSGGNSPTPILTGEQELAREKWSGREGRRTARGRTRGRTHGLSRNQRGRHGRVINKHGGWAGARAEARDAYASRARAHAPEGPA